MKKKYVFTKRMGFAPRKTTKKSLLDWKHLVNSGYNSYKEQIQRHKHDQEWLRNFVNKEESK